jgi:hypothetical protein
VVDWLIRTYVFNLTSWLGSQYSFSIIAIRCESHRIYSEDKRNLANCTDAVLICTGARGAPSSPTGGYWIGCDAGVV